MDKETFRQHLDEATTKLVDFTKTLCYNDIADKYGYRIIPSCRLVDAGDTHLTTTEIAVLKTWNEYKNKTLTSGQIVDLLYHDNKVPVWINMTIYEARKDLTIIDLFCSRRLRNDNELYHQGQIMPFHLQVPIPPAKLKIEKEGKFDINWQKRFDNKKSPINKLIQFLKYDWPA
jgi:hypothetical protein